MIASSKLRYIDHPARNDFNNDEWFAIVERAKRMRDTSPRRRNIFAWIDLSIASRDVADLTVHDGNNACPAVVFAGMLVPAWLTV